MEGLSGAVYTPGAQVSWYQGVSIKKGPTKSFVKVSVNQERRAMV